MPDINHEQLRKSLLQYYKTRTPVFLWGTMGIGKSTIVKDVAKKISKDLGREFLEGETDGLTHFGFIDVRISQLEPSDLRGLPDIKGNSTVWINPDWLPKNKDSCGILFFDELNLAPPSIQASAYQLILDRRLGSYKLPDGWVIISAGNTSEDKANVYELPAPLKNRFAHVRLSVPTVKVWIDWGMRNNIDNNIISFLEFKPSFLYKFDRTNKDNAFPTPRSWEFCSRLIDDDKLSEEDKEILISSCVGDGVGKEFIAFLKLQRKINIKDILNNPDSVKGIKELDLKYSLLSVVVEEYKKDKKQLNKILSVVDKLEPEFSILLLRFLNKARTDFKKEIIKDKVGNVLLQKYSKYLIDLKQDDS